MTRLPSPLSLLLGVLFALTARAEEMVLVPWVSLGADHHLHYRISERGDRIPDFSFAGYRGGGVKLPRVPVGSTLSPGTLEDDTPRIQQALDDLGSRTTAGNPAALLLLPGVYRLAGTLNLNHSGVVLRGSGSWEKGTFLQLTGAPHLAFEMGLGLETQGRVTRSPGASSIPITDSYVPCGASSFSVQNSSGLKVGDEIVINHPVTASWIAMMGMDRLVRDGKQETWLQPGSSILCGRTITGINGCKITIDVPLTDNYDSALLSPPGASIALQSPVARVAETGIEHLSVTAPDTASTLYGTSIFQGAKIGSVEDSWIRDVSFANTESTLFFGYQSRRMTIRQCRITHRGQPSAHGAKFLEITANGSQLLLYQCCTGGDSRFPYSSGSGVTGPNVALEFVSEGNSSIQPHQRWATGLLLDNCRVPAGDISLINRSIMGSGHGWAAGWSVAWNCAAARLKIEQPPSAMNWAVGCTGRWFGGDELTKAPAIQSPGKPVEPASLYRAQLRERLGESALASLDESD